MRFAEALVYYLAVPREAPEFSIERNAHTLIDMFAGTTQRDFAIDVTYHAYLLEVVKLR